MCLMILTLNCCLCSEPNKPRTLFDCSARIYAYEMVHIYRNAEIGTWAWVHAEVFCMHWKGVYSFNILLTVHLVTDSC